MGRLHLLELEDQPWFPAGLRNLMTDFLDVFASLTERPFEAFVPKLRRAMEAAETREIVDLCSGSAGPAVVISRMLKEREGYAVTALLTDLYPNRERFQALHSENGSLVYVEEPVDARHVPASLDGFRLLVNGFHHFRPDEARGILADAVKNRQGIAVLEFVGRSVPAFAGVLAVPLTVWLLTPFIRPFRWRRLFWTYLVPLVPFCCLWDGIVSCCRVYSPEEMRRLIDGVASDGYEWEAGRLPMRGGPALSYLLGRPVLQPLRDCPDS